MEEAIEAPGFRVQVQACGVEALKAELVTGLWRIMFACVRSKWLVVHPRESILPSK